MRWEGMWSMKRMKHVQDQQTESRGTCLCFPTWLPVCWLTELDRPEATFPAQFTKGKLCVDAWIKCVTSNWCVQNKTERRKMSNILQLCKRSKNSSLMIAAHTLFAHVLYVSRFPIRFNMWECSGQRLQTMKAELQVKMSHRLQTVQLTLKLTNSHSRACLHVWVLARFLQNILTVQLSVLTFNPLTINAAVLSFKVTYFMNISPSSEKSF